MRVHVERLGHKMAPIIADIERLNDALAIDADPFLGKGSVTISEIRSTSPSLCAVAAAALALGRQPVVDKWTFSTNGIAMCRLFGVPTVGFGPANEVHAHTPKDQCPVEHLTLAAQFYALFAGEYLEAQPPSPGEASAGERA